LAVKTKSNIVKIVVPVVACLLLPTCIALVFLCKFKGTTLSGLFSTCNVIVYMKRKVSMSHQQGNGKRRESRRN
jgi:hypothetical protein